MTNTAISAKEQITHTITFKNKEHEKVSVKSSAPQ